jgi:hypothetical protein
MTGWPSGLAGSRFPTNGFFDNRLKATAAGQPLRFSLSNKG